jgi:hypothetical protein
MGRGTELGKNRKEYKWECQEAKRGKKKEELLGE